MNGPVYLFAGGGTGGHLTPGIAVAEALLARDSTCRAVFVGAGRPVEQRLLSGTPFEHRVLSSQPWRRLFERPLAFLRDTSAALRTARRLLEELQPQCVIGLGGYASAPLVIMAGQRGIPVVLLEQNAIPGRANRWLSNWFPICVTFAAAAHWLPIRARVEVTGNPIRSSLRAALTRTDPVEFAAGSAPTLVILGGSQGAGMLNRVMPEVLISVRSLLSHWSIIHQTGDADAESVRERYAAAEMSVRVEPFLSDMAAIYRQATLVIARSGATSLTEFATAGVPAILVPLPTSAEQHQTENAQLFARAGAALAIAQTDFASTVTAIRSALAHCLAAPNELEAMRTAMRTLAVPDAIARVVAVIDRSVRHVRK